MICTKAGGKETEGMRVMQLEAGVDWREGVSIGTGCVVVPVFQEPSPSSESTSASGASASRRWKQRAAELSMGFFLTLPYEIELRIFSLWMSSGAVFLHLSCFSILFLTSSPWESNCTYTESVSTDCGEHAGNKDLRTMLTSPPPLSSLLSFTSMHFPLP